ncbi:MAG TPA: ankyrin repeat domain-containing protein [Terriglobales bacterium]|nr:ankyrin repeat domain-containing protein [Terriglobales bacterium]
MTSLLPERPNLEQLKRQAKDLLHAARHRDPVQLVRFRVLPAYSGKTATEMAEAVFSLHDAQSVIAREHGFASWNALRDRVEELTLDLRAAIDEFIAAATSGCSDRAARLLEIRPAIAHANFYCELLLADADAVTARLAKEPALATQPGGPRSWTPLQYLCHTSLPNRRSAAAEAQAAAIARRLIAAGADPNQRYPWFHHGVRRPVLWGACCTVHNLELARVLLEAGANPNDGVTLPLTAASDDRPVLDLLARHGADANTTWATDGAPTLYAMMTWGRKPGGIRWLLKHGAKADAVFEQNGESPLHLAAARWTSDVAEVLVAHGADVNRRRRDGRTPFAIAQLNGNQEVARWLAEHGANAEVALVDQFVAAARAADRQRAEAMLAAHPELRAQLTEEHYGALHRAAETGDTAALDVMLACGFDPNRPDDSIGKTVLHSAAHEAQIDAVRLLLQRGASVTVTDREFQGTPLLWAADGARTRGDRNYDGVAKLLLDAGSPTEWAAKEPSEELIETVAMWVQRFRPMPANA